MKNKKFLFLLFIVGFMGCQPDEVGDVDTSLDEHTQYLMHAWSLTGVEQVDNNAQPGQLASLDISAAILANGGSNLTFNDGSFESTGAISDLIGTSGSWSLDNPNFPTQVLTNRNGNATALILSQSILEFSENLVFQVNKTNCLTDEPSVSYIYTFTKS